MYYIKYYKAYAFHFSDTNTDLCKVLLIHYKYVILFYMFFYFEKLFVNYIDVSKFYYYGYCHKIISVNLAKRMSINIK